MGSQHRTKTTARQVKKNKNSSNKKNSNDKENFEKEKENFVIINFFDFRSVLYIQVYN